MNQNFGTVKVGVCDCFWTPRATASNPNPEEIFLGLTKGGVVLNYEPTYHEINVDQFGSTATESVLIGEKISIKVPLAETDLDKIGLFSHTATNYVSGEKRKLLFGRRPGFRLEGVAGRIRIHPIAMGSSQEEDVTIYKAVNKAPLELSYKLDNETIYNCEFIGMVERLTLEEELSGVAVPFLWDMGDPTIPIK